MRVRRAGDVHACVRRRSLISLSEVWTASMSEGSEVVRNLAATLQGRPAQAPANGRARVGATAPLPAERLYGESMLLFDTDGRCNMTKGIAQ